MRQRKKEEALYGAESCSFELITTVLLYSEDSKQLQQQLDTVSKQLEEATAANFELRTANAQLQHLEEQIAQMVNAAQHKDDELEALRLGAKQNLEQMGGLEAQVVKLSDQTAKADELKAIISTLKVKEILLLQD